MPEVLLTGGGVGIVDGPTGTVGRPDAERDIERLLEEVHPSPHEQEVQPDVRPPLGVGDEQRAEERLSGHGIGGHPRNPGGLEPGVGHGAIGFFGQAHDLGAALGVGAPGLGRSHAARRSVEQPHPEPPLERRHATRHGLLRHVQPPPGFGEGAGCHHGREQAQIVEHRPASGTTRACKMVTCFVAAYGEPRRTE